jgi:UrcA family protein
VLAAVAADPIELRAATGEQPMQPTRMSVRRSLNMTPQNPCWYRLLTIVVFFLSAAAALPASAGDRPTNDEPSATVKFGDLDPNTVAGRHELLHRLSKAAARVCVEQARSLAALGYTQVHLACYRGTLQPKLQRLLSC